MSMLRWPRVERGFNVAERDVPRIRSRTNLLGEDNSGAFILYARVRVESRTKDGNFDRVDTAYAAGMGLV